MNNQFQEELPMTKYAEMLPGDMLAEVRDDAAKWAAAFCEINPGVAEDVMIGWFANAIENTWDVRCSRFTQDAEAWIGFQDRVFANRRMWAELESIPAEHQ